jgi:hypothetical protein
MMKLGDYTTVAVACDWLGAREREEFTTEFAEEPERTGRREEKKRKENRREEGLWLWSVRAHP